MNKLLLATTSSKSNNPSFYVPETEELVVSLTGAFDGAYYSIGSFVSDTYYPQHGIIEVEGISANVSKVQIGIESQINNTNEDLVLSMEGNYTVSDENYTSPIGTVEALNVPSNVSSIQVNIEQ